MKAPAEMKRGIGHKVNGMGAAAAPPAAAVEGREYPGLALTQFHCLHQAYRRPTACTQHQDRGPDEKWGETPCAFIELKPNSTISEKEIIDFCRKHLARFKAPRAVVFGELPKTSTGKIQKFMLREKAKSTSAIDS